MAGNLVIVAVPDENDRVWKVSSEKIPHLTLLFLGDVEKANNLDQIMQFVEHAANTSLKRFYLTVDRRGELGADKADVLFFRKGYDLKAIREFRATLLQDNNIKTAYDSAEQFEGPWQPHLTLGYPETPANKMPDDWSPSFYDVSFNKIAVWTGDFEGPDFLLKDYWDEFDALETVPMDVAMSDIEHHGVKGMKWGVRKAASAGKAVGRGALRVANDIAFESEGVRRSAANGVSSRAASMHAKEDLPKLKEKYSGTKAETLKGRMKNPIDKHVIAYRSDARVMYRDRINDEVAKLPTNSSGTRKYTIEDGGKTNAQYNWHLKAVDTKRTIGHADTTAEELPAEFTVKPVFDADGWIIDVKFEDLVDPLVQTAGLGVEFLEHFGVKGMKWGQHKTEQITVGGRTKMVTPKKAVKADKAWEKQIYTVPGAVAVHNAMADHFNSRIGAVNDKHPTVNLIKRPNDPDAKAYNADVEKLYSAAYSHAVTTVHGSSPTGKKKAVLVEENGDMSIKVVDASKDAKHAATDNLDAILGALVLKVKVGSDGKIEQLNYADDAAAHTADLGAEFLAHYGIKGMRWGHRKEAPAAVPASAMSHVPQGARRKTKIAVQGGENHPAHEDALKVAQAQAKLKKSGPSALSNKELRDMQERLNLERNVTQLVGSTTRVGKGRQFVRNITGVNQEVNNAANAGMQSHRLSKQFRSNFA